MFDNCLFSIQDFDGLASTHDLHYSMESFWAQLHGLPFGCMNCQVGEHISSSLGTVEQVDVDQNGIGWGQFLRVKVAFNITRPLA